VLIRIISLRLVFTILLGDLSPLKWRGFMQGLSSMPYVVNFAISPRIVSALHVDTGNDNWRWGYGMFAIIIPACAAPILFVLYWADHRAKKAGSK
jgi:MFS family permease